MSTSCATEIPIQRIATFYGRYLSPAEVYKVKTVIKAVFENIDSLNPLAYEYAEDELFMLKQLCIKNPQLTPTYKECQSFFERMGKTREVDLQKRLRELEHMNPK
ncbi:MAG: hypothetical protein KR126chlam2_00188 [Chlamydiae bacterium]|nr:hypothetical protein [Chlamydiota bacterium]